MIDSRIPRFSQAIQALALALAFLVDAVWVVPVVAGIMLAGLVGGPRWNLFARIFRVLPTGLPGELEPAAPPRFAQGVGVAFLTTATVGLIAFERGTGAWWAAGWAPALVVMALAAVAATTSF